MESFDLQTVDKSGESHTFIVQPDVRAAPMSIVFPSVGMFSYYTFTVQVPEPAEPLSRYQLMLCVYQDGQIRVDGIYNSLALKGDRTYSGMGILPALLSKLTQRFGCDILSSTNDSDNRRHQKEWQNPAAASVWQSLVDSGLASYDSRSSMFIFHHQPLA